MTKRKLIGLVCTLFLAGPLAVSSAAGDFKCTEDECIAKKEVDGRLEEFKFERDDVVSTEAGYVVNTGDGWNPV